MPVVAPLKDEQIDPALLEQLRFLEGPLGFIPNSMKTMAYHPAVAQAFIGLHKAVMECRGELTMEFKRLIAYTASLTAGCLYCQSHTVLGSERSGATEQRLRTVCSFDDSPHFTAAEKAALTFARAAAQVPNGVDAAMEAELREHWSTGDIVEIMAVIALFGYLNRWNDSLGTPLEEMPTDAGNRHLAEATGWQVGKHKQS